MKLNQNTMDTELHRIEDPSLGNGSKGMPDLPSYYNPNLDRIPIKYLAPKHVHHFANNPHSVARLLIEAYDGCDSKVQQAARLARRVMEMLEFQLRSRDSNHLVDSAAAGQRLEVKRRLEQGQEVDSKHTILGCTALHMASSLGYLGVIKILLAFDADVAVERDSDGNTPLHCAAQHGQLEVARCLIAHRADKLRPNKSGQRPYDLARDAGFPDVAALLRSPPRRPKHAIACNILARSATLRWDAPRQHHGVLDHYEVFLVAQTAQQRQSPETEQECSESEDSSCEVRIRVPGDRLLYNIPTGVLAAKTEYVFSVRAHNAAGYGGYSKECVFETLSDVPDAPINPNVTKVSCTSLEVSWHQPELNNGAIIANYHLQVKVYPNPDDELVCKTIALNADGWETVCETIPGSKIVIEERESGRYRNDVQIPHITHQALGLTPGTAYIFRVCAQNEVGWGNWEFTPAMAITRPPVVAREVNARSMVLSWGDSIEKKAKVQVNHWQLQQRRATLPVGGNAVSEARQQSARTSTEESRNNLTDMWEIVGERIPGIKSSYRVENLRPYYKGSGYRSWEDCAVSDIIATSNSPPDPVDPPPIAEFVSHNSVRLKWDEPAPNGAHVEKYAVRYSASNVSKSWVTFSEDIYETNATVVGLSSGTEYIFMVKAQNALGWSPYSCSSEPVTTLATCPPERPTVISRKDSFVTLEWSIKRSEKIDILEYQLQQMVFPKKHFGEEPQWVDHSETIPVPSHQQPQKYMVTGLAPVSEYSFRVRALTKQGWSLYSEPSERIRTTRRY